MQLFVWMQAHWAVLALAIKSILDVILILSPSIEANGVFHWLYLQLQKAPNNPPPPAPAA